MTFARCIRAPVKALLPLRRRRERITLDTVRGLFVIVKSTQDGVSQGVGLLSTMMRPCDCYERYRQEGLCITLASEDRDQNRGRYIQGGNAIASALELNLPAPRVHGWETRCIVRRGVCPFAVDSWSGVCTLVICAYNHTLTSLP